MIRTVTVPREPTDDMISAAHHYNYGFTGREDKWADTYRVILAAAPPAEDETAALRERMEALCQETASLRAEVERLKDALAPFAAEASSWDEGNDGERFGEDFPICLTPNETRWPGVDSRLFVGDLFRARALLDQEKA